MIQTIQTASFTLTTQQIQALELMNEFLRSTKNLFLLVGYAGTGKAQPINTPVLTSTGWTPIGHLKSGDSVISGDGSRVRVLGVFPQGIKPVARINFSDGSSTLCCYDHLWLTETYHERNANRIRAYKAQKKGKIPQDRIGRVKTTREISESLLARNGTQKNHRIPVMKCADFDVVNVPVEPYLLGCLLGDGSLTQGTPKLTTADAEIAEFCSKLVPLGVEMKFITGKEYLEYKLIGTKWQGQWRINPLSNALRALGVWGKYSYERFIPQSYLINSKEVRLELLRGLMDTDGTVSANGYETSFSTSSVQLAVDVRSLVESLGGICPIGTRNTASGRLSYRLAICLPPDINPFHLPRKRDRVKPKTRYVPFRYQVRGLSAEEFPRLPIVTAQQAIYLPAETLKEGLRGCLFATTSDETKLILTGVHLKLEQDTLEFAATDGHRLAVLQAPTQGIEGKKKHSDKTDDTSLSFTVPAKALRELERILEMRTSPDPVALYYKKEEEIVAFHWGKQRLVSRCLEGEYPAYPELLKHDFKHQVTLEKAPLVKALERIAVLADKKEKTVKLYFNSEAQQLSLFMARDFGEGEELIPACISGESLHICFNIKYLLDAVKAFSCSKVQMQLTSSEGAAILVPLGNRDKPHVLMDVKYLLMPVNYLHLQGREV